MQRHDSRNRAPTVSYLDRLARNYSPNKRARVLTHFTDTGLCHVAHCSTLILMPWRSPVLGNYAGPTGCSEISLLRILIRLLAINSRFRIRIPLGVTSTSSSSSMKSRHSSSDIWRGGTSFTVASSVEARMLVFCFCLVGLTSISPVRRLSPMIIPWYTATPGPVNGLPRSCTPCSPYATDIPVWLAVNTPLRVRGGRVRHGCHPTN